MNKPTTSEVKAVLMIIQDLQNKSKQLVNVHPQMQEINTQLNVLETKLINVLEDYYNQTQDSTHVLKETTRYLENSIRSRMKKYEVQNNLNFVLFKIQNINSSVKEVLKNCGKIH